MALRRIHPRRKPLFVSRAFSSSSNPPFPPPPPPTTNEPADATSSPNPPSSSLFRDIRERLKPSPPPRPNSGGGKTPLESLSNVRNMLKNFRTPQAGNASASDRGVTTPSFQDLLRSSAGNTRVPPGLDDIRKSLKTNLHQRPTPFLSPHAHKIFDREKGHKDDGKDSDDTALTRTYSYEELGKRLQQLRPANDSTFSLEELQGRIANLAKLEKQEGALHGEQMAAIRMSLESIERKPALSAREVAPMQMALLGNIGGQSQLDYMRHPPQEELLERYFHPDHMSSEEKMKLELQKVRDEFKMSENDCGSARVQIAQLTVKIKHLSSVLHKKDKHSRKGLQDMVQRRKKYLKYLRRTDWDSYCLVLSKLGLRDVPEYKAPDYRSKHTSKAKSKKSKRKTKA